jgi:hypothetical protein
MKDVTDKGRRRIDLGEVAYAAYRKRLAEHQPEKCLPWHKTPPYMRDVWTAVAEAVIAHEKGKEMAMP